MTKSNIRFRTEKSTASKCYTRKTQAEHLEMFFLFILSALSVFMVCILLKNGKCLSHYLCPSPSYPDIRYFKKDCHKVKNLREKKSYLSELGEGHLATHKQLSTNYHSNVEQSWGNKIPLGKSLSTLLKKNTRRKKKKCRQ